MRLDVYLTADEIAGAATGRVVAVIDVLRASTTIAAALDNGARAVIPFADTDDMVVRSKQFERDTVLLTGERKMLPLNGFDLGNSPREFTSDVVAGKTVLITTTNGTRAILAAQGAHDIVIAAYVNCAAVTAMLRTALRGGTDIALVCAGTDGHFALEDAACAGRYVRSVTRRLSGVALNDAAHACSLLAHNYGDQVGRVLIDSVHGRALADAGFREDLSVCAGIDTHPVVPVFTERQITKLGPERER